MAYYKNTKTVQQDRSFSKPRRSAGCPKPNSKSEELMPLYAAYLNMARMNLYRVLKHISATVGVNDSSNEEQMESMKVIVFDEKLKKEQQEKVKIELSKRLPFLKSMSSCFVDRKNEEKNVQEDKNWKITVENKDLSSLLQDFVHVIVYQRNNYTHTKHYDPEKDIKDEIEREKRLVKPIESAFDSAKRKMADIHGYDRQAMDFINGNERVSVQGKGSDKHVEYYKDYYFRMTNDEHTCLSDMGVAFLICKLLPKKYAVQFLQQSKMFTSRTKGGWSPFTKEENEIMANIFCAENVRLPKGRMEVESVDDKVALGLDMLNELQKCPKELYDTFCQQDKHLFDTSHSDLDTVSDVEDINQMKRHGDRFPQLAMRYIDEIGVLKGMVFQVSVGSYRYKFYEKAAIDSSVPDRVRILQKEINGFGHLSAIEKKRKEKYDPIIRWIKDGEYASPDTSMTKPYLTDKRASYAITGNRIGLIWDDMETKELKKGGGLFLPSLPTPKQECKNGSWVIDKGQWEDNIKPKCWLSIYDLPALVFLHLLGGKPSKEIRSTAENLIKLFNDIKSGTCRPISAEPLPVSEEERMTETRQRMILLDDFLATNYNLSIRQIPEKIVDYLLGLAGGEAEEEKLKSEKSFNEWAEKRILREIDDVKNRKGRLEDELKKVGTKLNRVGKKNFVDIRPGKLASWLSKDIMAMQPKIDGKDNEGGGKLTGLNYSVMQGTIATYHGDGRLCRQTELGEMFLRAGLVGKSSPNRHPFLGKVLEGIVNDTVDFYKKYLNAKLDYLHRLFSSKKYCEAYFLHEGLKNHAPKDKEYIQSLAGRYKDTLQLPDGLFTKAISDILKDNEDEVIRDAATGENSNNVAYLLRVYFTRKYSDDSQPFYSQWNGHFNRHYRLFDVLYGQGKEVYLSDEEISGKLRKGSADKSSVKKNIDQYVANLMIPEKAKWVNGRKITSQRKANPEEREKMRNDCIKWLRECQNSEKTIRRYKAEDMMLFLMAKRLLWENNLLKEEAQNIDAFKLNKILPIGCRDNSKGNILNQQIEFSALIELRSDEKNESFGKKTIHQKELKLKNFGDFYRFIYDPRIGRLLSQLEGDTFEYEDVDKELEVYDNSRRDAFAAVHRMEHTLYDGNDVKEDLKNNKLKSFHNGNPQSITDEKDIYNNFGNLLYNYSNLDSETQGIIVGLRNMVSHNKYMDKIGSVIGQENMELPKVMEELMAWLEDHVQDVKNTYNDNE